MNYPEHYFLFRYQKQMMVHLSWNNRHSISFTYVYTYLVYIYMMYLYIIYIYITYIDPGVLKNRSIKRTAVF